MIENQSWQVSGNDVNTELFDVFLLLCLRKITILLRFRSREFSEIDASPQ